MASAARGERKGPEQSTASTFGAADRAARRSCAFFKTLISPEWVFDFVASGDGGSSFGAAIFFFRSQWPAQRWTGKGKEMARRRFSRDGKTGKAGTEPSQDPKGLKKLSKEADKQLGSRGGIIAEKLGATAEKGDLEHLEALVELAKRNARAKRGSREKKSENAAAAIVSEIQRNKRKAKPGAIAAPAAPLELQNGSGNSARA